MKLYFKFLKMHLKSSMEYKVSFFLTLFGQFIISFTSFLGLYYLFLRFHTIEGFNFNEVLLCYSSILMSYSIVDCFAYGFKNFSTTISNGQFDRFMIRPCRPIFLVLTSNIDFSTMGKLVQAILIMVYAIKKSDVIWNFYNIVIYMGMIWGGIFVFSALYIIYASLCFFTIEGLEFISIFTDGGREFGKYPMGVYGKNMLKLFTFLVPLACVQYYPLLFLIGKKNEFYYAITPLYTILLFITSLIIWCYGVKNYKSTGS